MPGTTMTVSGSTLSRILRDVAKGRIPVEKLALRSQDGRRVPIKRVVRQGNQIQSDNC